ncbi:MAG: phosphoribosylanthranilate isomerase [Armatimonadota bacterium]|nr:phosphoribosylanthranilate isomerase [Armatimonadota bacterium]MDR7401098.1 phosphoribosylanthranilate isomerase [Armatimonadota bacterium]MDR7403550.1 phosphoribosylanthranilate isomerase [Armatimonadota bacterium]MDR7436393.1 phosphoribosylanthranilate isomerase [Armatimonadota bacterium]MDR7471750.1 phosphoribosylanthranilate isomerase [Armatimonadota bacterium]
MTRVKICGITDPEAAQAAVEAGADAVGFVFAPSRRRVTADQAAAIAWSLPPFVARVGVFVDADRGRILEAVEACGLSAVQLHGDEPPELCAALPVPVIKAVRVSGGQSLQGLERYRVSAFLLDAYDPTRPGGTGRTFDWSLAAGVARVHRIVLSGGLTPANVAAALEQVRPYAVDVSSGVETDGRKDPAKIRAFVEAVRRWDAGGGGRR